MEIRLVSDLHVDINNDGNFGFRHDKQDILLIAGDIAGSYQREEKFLNGLAKDVSCPTYVVAGNHLGYDYNRDPMRYFMSTMDFGRESVLIGTKQWSIDYLKKNVPENTYYLDNDWVDLGDCILFGGCMYSDYKLFENQELAQKVGEYYLNDFRYVHIYDKKQKVVRHVTSDDYISFHKAFMRRLRKCLKETNKDVIVLTHFAPSPQSISDKYNKGADKYISASYCSNLEKFLIKNPRIKLWCHGHMHEEFDYIIGGCRVVCCPYGYHSREQKQSPKKWHGKLISYGNN